MIVSGDQYYQNRQLPVARKQYDEALSIYYKLGNQEDWQYLRRPGKI